MPRTVLTQVLPAGAGVIVNVKGLEVPSGFATATFAVPAVARSLAGTVAVTAVALLQVPTQVVGSAVPFHWMAGTSLKLDPWAKLDP